MAENPRRTRRRTLDDEFGCMKARQMSHKTHSHYDHPPCPLMSVSRHQPTTPELIRKHGSFDVRVGMRSGLFALDSSVSCDTNYGTYFSKTNRRHPVFDFSILKIKNV